jgi:Domain of unknown function (DUF3482)/50S ribosome-binding GTPase
MTTPNFAVVGRPNKGKSSIVATLARDDSVYIDQRSGSTRRTQQFPMRLGDETLYLLYDTPGMQRARAVLAWLEQHSGDAASRPATVRAFVQQHESDARYADEIEMLRPILDGAGIIYVVDGSCPYGAEYEPEMEILRWTGNPSLALINPIHSDDYVEQWRNGLSQYFRTVRVFDAHHAEFRKQLDLLTLFGHLDQQWQVPLQRAVEALEQERRDQHRASADHIADMICRAITYSESQDVLDGVPLAPVRETLMARYKTTLVRSERRCRSQIEELFYYSRIQRQESTLNFSDDDLFNQENWYLWGLSKKSLLAVAAASGAVVGGGAGLMVDAAAGGLLGGLGTLVSGAGGAALSGYGAWKYSDDIGEIRIGGIPAGGQRLTVGPSPNLNFPFVLLGRALQHHQQLARRTHAHREAMHLDHALLAAVSDRDRKRLGKLFAYMRKEKNIPEQQRALSDLVNGFCLAVDQTD